MHGACGGAFLPTHAHRLAPVLAAALEGGSPGKAGTLAVVGVMHTALLCAPAPDDPATVALLQPAASAALASFVAPDDEGGRPNELVHTGLAGASGRTLLCSPALFSAAAQAAGLALGLPDLHVHFAHRWASMVDAIVLSSQRKLACLSLASLLPLDPKLLPMAPEVLAFCVSVLLEFHPELDPEHGDADADGEGGGDGGGGGGTGGGPRGASPPMLRRPPPPVLTPSMPAVGEHAEFARRLTQSGLDPIGGLDLRSALQRCLQHAASAHGEAFEAQVRSLDPSTLRQLQACLGHGPG